MPTLNMYLSGAIILDVAIHNNLSKCPEFLREISVVEFCYSETIVFGIHSNFTYDSETYDSETLFGFFESLFFS